jgi:hypothetical protein
VFHRHMLRQPSLAPKCRAQYRPGSQALYDSNRRFS